RRRRTQIDLADLAHSTLVADVQSILTGFVGEVGDRLSVGRPGRIPLCYTGRIRQVADVALFRGYRKNFTADTENRARPGRGYCCKADAPGFNLLEVRPYFEEITGQMDAHFAVFVGVQIVQM